LAISFSNDQHLVSVFRVSGFHSSILAFLTQLAADAAGQLLIASC